MSYKIIQSQTVEIPANTSAWGNLTAEGGSLLSFGLANSGYQTEVYPTQLYITGNTSAFYQVDNTKSVPVTIQFNGVVDTDGNAAFGPITDQGSKPVKS